MTTQTDERRQAVASAFQRMDGKDAVIGECVKHIASRAKITPAQARPILKALEAEGLILAVKVKIRVGDRKFAAQKWREVDGYRLIAFDRCACAFDRREGSTIQRIPLFSTHRCDRSGKTTMRHATTGAVVKFCKRHADMAREGFVHGNLNAMEVNSRADYRRLPKMGKPRDFGKWVEAPGASFAAPEPESW